MIVMDKPKRLIASVFLSLAAMYTTVISAGPFDERVKAPRVTTDQALHSQLKAFFSTYQKKQLDADPAAFIRDRAAYKQWADAHFSFTQALDEGRRLDDLSAFGLIAQPDGSYTVDLKKFPQWDPLDGRLTVFLNLDVLESYVPVLKARGFRDEDVEALRTYVSTHDPRQLTYAEGKPLVDSFAKRVQKRAASRQQPDPEEVMAYRYQKDRIKREARRQWAVGLMDGLDKQRQRILVSFFDEQESERTFGVPTEPFSATLQEEVQPLITGEYAQKISEDELKLTREMAKRTEKLNGGQQQ
jgi:hypothetical protein